ncbi:MAG: hypothetical protein E6G89_12155 [Alphaproteobacteria bacterium]|nr:MAG: hypothetical protein E6G89_12155 [Alphaproteobacteria bacterium]
MLAAICLCLAALAAALPPTDPSLLSNDPISRGTYSKRLLSLSLDRGPRLLLLSYFCWSIGMYIFLGLYPSWLVQHGLSHENAGKIGLLLLLGEIGGLLGALLSGRLAAAFAHPLLACAMASLGITIIILAIPRSERSSRSFKRFSTEASPSDAT